MEERLDSSTPAGSVDKSRVLDVKPIRYLVPIFPNSYGMSMASGQQAGQFTGVPLSGPFPSGVQPFYPFVAPHNPTSAQNHYTDFGFDGSIPAPAPLNSYRTPSTRGKGRGRGRPKRRAFEEDEYDDLHETESYACVSHNNVVDAKDSDDLERGSRSGRKAMVSGSLQVEKLANDILMNFRLLEFDDVRRYNGDRDTVGTILLVLDLIRRKLTQLEESKGVAPGTVKRPDLKATNLLMTKGVRTNVVKRSGHVPGVEIGDIFFFRMEMCLVGLHTPSMAGIDYMSTKNSDQEDTVVAVSVVSSGGYDDDGEDSNVLVYSGQGGVQRKDGKLFDQKLERGNLALQKSVHCANDVRVIRGINYGPTAGSKIYVYDGLYNVQESWTEKKSGCNVFKYKLVRIPGQQEAFSVWKSIQQWKDGTAPRGGVILPDLTSGAESLPVALVNDVDRERGPAHFTYFRSLKYDAPFTASKPSSGCHCSKECGSGDSNCTCNHKNDGSLPYSSLGILLTERHLIYECGSACGCPSTCRNRISQAGIKFRLEVFKTKERGWGLRSWDPIRAGSFICEYAGDIIKNSETIDSGYENDDSYIFDATRYFPPLQPEDDSTPSSKAPFPLIISAKYNGNVARFMNHSCSPNIFWLPVLRESNYESYLHICFFAIRHIPPMQELTFDYGIVPPDKQDRVQKKCLCGSTKCRGYFF